MVNEHTKNRVLLIYLALGVVLSLLILVYSVLHTYSNNLIHFKETLQKAVVKKALLQQDIQKYKDSLNQLIKFSGNIKSPHRAILKRIDEIKSLYPEATVIPSNFIEEGNLIAMNISIHIRTKSYYNIIQLINSMFNERMPIFVLDNLSIKPSIIKQSTMLEGKLKGKFVAIKRHD